MTFQAISAGTSAGTAGAGIVLRSTGSVAGLTVTGTGTSGSGGVIQNKTGADISSGSPPLYNGGTTGAGIILENTRSVSLSWMQLHDFTNFAIFGSNVDGFSFLNSMANATGAATNGDNDAADEGTVRFEDLTGSASITNSTIEDGREDSARIVNPESDGSTLNLNVTGSTFRDSGSIGLIVQTGRDVGDNQVINVNVTNSTFSNNPARHLFVIANSAGSFNVNVGTSAAGSGGTFTGMPAAMLDIAANSSGSSTFNVRNASFTVDVAPFASIPINIFMGSETSGTFTGTLANNTVTGGNNSGFGGIQVTGKGKGATMTIAILNNTVSQIAGTGITVSGAQSGDTNTMNVTIQGNSVNMTDPLAANGIQVDAAVNSLGATTMSAQIGGVLAAQKNTSSVTVAGNNDIRVTSRFSASVMRLPGYTGGAQDTAAVGNFIRSNNTITDVSVSTGLAPGGTFTNTSPPGTACPVP